ncbi:hypothetical protein ACVWWN_007389 [Mycobacterium sp. URHB0021]|jgi:hypothetical protein
MCGCGWAGCSQRNVQQYRRTAYSSTTACKSHRALAGVLNPCTHAAQQIGPFASVRQEIGPCLVWSFPSTAAFLSPNAAPGSTAQFPVNNGEYPDGFDQGVGDEAPSAGCVP